MDRMKAILAVIERPYFGACHQCGQPATCKLRHVDGVDDEFCTDCYEEAWQSGNYTTEEHDES